MGRLNEVRLFGYVTDQPIIQKTINNEYVAGRMHLTVIRCSRSSGESGGEKDRILFDWPLILTNDPDLIRQMEKLTPYDLVELKGMFLTRKVIKNTTCTVCGAKYRLEGNICYVRPFFMIKRNLGNDHYTEKKAIIELRANREISNNILILGNLCNDVNYFKGTISGRKIETSVYQIATDRKYYIMEDDPESRTDFPIVRSYQKQAVKDRNFLHVGSCILIDGFLHTRQFERTSICDACSNEFTWMDNTIEIIPYINEFIANYNTEEEAEEVINHYELEKQEEEKKILATYYNQFK